jgi:hypothetical protein
MEAAVLVPWRPGCAHREAAWRHLKALHARSHPWPVIEGAPADGEWSKATAVADALSKTDADVLIVADADVWTDGLPAAVAAVQDGAPWVVPHGRVRRLDGPSTAAVLAGGEWGGTLDQPAYMGYPGGGITVLPAATYRAAPLDPRFVGWGQEDLAWSVALKRIAGAPWRGKSDLWHLWHPPQPRMTRQVGSEAGAELLKRYQRARTRDAMRTLLEEVTQWQSK